MTVIVNPTGTTGGMRLRHPTARNCRYTVVDSDRLYATPYTCAEPRYGGCGVTHLWKTYHLDLDDTGTVIVNVPLYQRIKARLALDGFIVVEHVATPPPQLIGAASRLPRLDRPVETGA